MLTIISNGSKWAGQEPDSIEELIDVLGRYTLDPRFEAYGNFVKAEQDSGVVRFFGNFQRLSHVFNIETDESDVIERLTAAIRKNQETEAYRQARNETVPAGGKNQ